MHQRSQDARLFAIDAGTLARQYFQGVGDLTVEDKGPQDFVTEADKAVELRIRAMIEASYPDDGIVGEEHDPKPSRSGYTWVIDPIDGTTNFINAIPAWCVVIAVIKDDAVQIGVIHDPVHDETFSAVRGEGAMLNGSPLVCPADTALSRGSVSTGYSRRISDVRVQRVIEGILRSDSVFHRNASGALSLAYVAAGRLIGYVEEHMNAWDCLAGQLLISEAGGRIETQSADLMIENGGRVIAGSVGVFNDLLRIAEEAFQD